MLVLDNASIPDRAMNKDLSHGYDASIGFSIIKQDLVNNTDNNLSNSVLNYSGDNAEYMPTETQQI